MEDLGSVPGGVSGAVGALTAALGGAIWLVRRVMRNDKVDSAEAVAQVDILARLSEELAKANSRADLADDRAAKAYKELNEAYREIGELKGTVSALSAEVRWLKERMGYGQGPTVG